MPRNSNNSLHATQIRKVNGIDCLGMLVGYLMIPDMEGAYEPLSL